MYGIVHVNLSITSDIYVSKIPLGLYQILDWFFILKKKKAFLIWDITLKYQNLGYILDIRLKANCTSLLHVNKNSINPFVRKKYKSINFSLKIFQIID